MSEQLNPESQSFLTLDQLYEIIRDEINKYFQEIINDSDLTNLEKICKIIASTKALQQRLLAELQNEYPDIFLERSNQPEVKKFIERIILLISTESVLQDYQFFQEDKSSGIDFYQALAQEIVDIIFADVLAEINFLKKQLTGKSEVSSKIYVTTYENPEKLPKYRRRRQHLQELLNYVLRNLNTNLYSTQGSLTTGRLNKRAIGFLTDKKSFQRILNSILKDQRKEMPEGIIRIIADILIFTVFYSPLIILQLNYNEFNEFTSLMLLTMMVFYAIELIRMVSEVKKIMYSWNHTQILYHFWIVRMKIISEMHRALQNEIDQNCPKSDELIYRIIQRLYSITRAAEIEEPTEIEIGGNFSHQLQNGLELEQ